MFQTIKSKVKDISNKTDDKISELDQSSDQKWQTLGRLVEDLTNKMDLEHETTRDLFFSTFLVNQFFKIKNPVSMFCHMLSFLF